MPFYRVCSERHHDVEAPVLCIIVECSPEQLELVALEAVWDWAFSYIEPVSWEPLTTRMDALSGALDRARQQGEAKLACRGEFGEEYLFALWRKPSDGGLNFGIGASSDGTSEGTDKRENHWIRYEEWAPNQLELDQLVRRPKEELALEILKLRAVT